MSGKNISVIGSGFAGIAAASFLAQAGNRVTIFEKNEQPGGRARVWESDGFRFDMGPSWYWMPDVFEHYFSRFGRRVSDYYSLKRLDPGYRIFFSKKDVMDVPASMDEIEKLFDAREPGSAEGLRKFLAQAAYKYKVGMGDYVFRPSHSITEFIDLRLIRESFRIQMLTKMSKHVRQYFKNPELIKLLEFPVLFLGATPQNTPALYSMMNHADLTLGTWYPGGGMNEIIKGMVALANELGVRFELNSEVKKIGVKKARATEIVVNERSLETDFVIAAADYAHVDQHLLEKPYRNYNAPYWDSRTMSPSCLIFYIGLNKKLSNVQHHNLFFDQDFEKHAYEIYTKAQWPTEPLFYVSVPSVTDSSVAPEGCENLFFLMPVAPGLHDDDTLRERYFDLMIGRFEQITGNTIRHSIIVKRSYSLNNFVQDYHSFKGNAYGLANTLAQTAFFKPAMRSKKVENLLFTGQLTVPGPGVPPSLISGEIVARETLRLFHP
ncbi:MAG: phytoene desaturase [Mucilaginibacter polytrichastri]|nr:phytoene desaturase [Mucilaginibacter polytrichastri]